MNIAGIANEKSSRILGLDAFRTLAIVGVTLFHMFPEMLPGGYFGVSLFFVLTGYLLGFTSERARLSGQFSIINYYCKRIKRIYPSLLVVILLTIGVYHFFAPKVIESIRPEIMSVVFGYNNWWQIAQNADYFARISNGSPFTHLWFLGIELQYYLIWPLLFMIYSWLENNGGKNVGLAFIAVLAVAATFLMPVMHSYNVDVTRLYYGTDTRVYALLLGAIMGLRHAAKMNNLQINYEDDDNIFISTFKYAVFVMCLGLTLLSYKFLSGQNPVVYKGAMLAMTIFFCMMFIIVADTKLMLGRILENPLFSWIGKHSYGIFLWQYPVIFLCNYTGWNKLPYASAMEIAAIMLLTMWFDSVMDSIKQMQLPTVGKHLIMIQSTLFLTVTFLSTIIMGFGCRGLIVSAGTKSYSTELQARIEANEAEIAKQNEQLLAAQAIVEQNQQPIQQAQEAQQPQLVQLAPQQTLETIQPQPAQPQTLQPNQQTPTPQPAPVAPVKEVNINGAVCIGDSVMLSAANDLLKVMPNCYIDAKVSRHLKAGIRAIDSFAAEGRLGDIVVIGLGTNHSMDEYSWYTKQLRELIQELGSSRHIFLVNIYTPPYYDWEKAHNEFLKKLASEYSNVSDIDWYGLITQHPEYLDQDGVHPNVKGGQAYAKLIHDSIVEELSKQP